MHNRRYVDFHTHTFFSDGSFSPEQIVSAADEISLAAVAITDHDTLDGIPRALAEASKYPKLKVIVGVEISAHYAAGPMHILGLGLDTSNADLLKLLADMRQARESRSPRIIEKLNQIGVDISLEEVYKHAKVSFNDGSNAAGNSNQTGVISRVHFAQMLIKKGYVKTLKEAFDKFLGNNAPAFVEKDQLKPADVIPTLKQAAKVVALAHPGELKYNNFAHFEEILRSLIEAGLNGIECYHSSHSDTHTRKFLELAQKYKLNITGGSDFHGLGKPTVQLGKPRTPVSVVSDLLL